MKPEVDRGYFHCAGCGGGFSPEDAALELASEVIQYDLQQKVSWLAEKMSYDDAVKVAEVMTGQKVSAHVIHDTVGRLEEAAVLEEVLPNSEEISARIESLREGGEGDFE